MEKLVTIKQLVERAADVFGDKAFLKYKVGGGEIEEKSFSQALADSNAFGCTLKKLDQLGKHVAVLGPTSYYWIITYLGTVNSGGVIVPVDRELTADDIIDVLDRADVTVLVFDDMYKDVAKIVKEKSTKITHCINMQAEQDDNLAFSFTKLLAENKGAVSVQIDPHKLCTILYTSGTTGKSKGVMLTNANLLDNVQCSDMRVNSDSVVMTILPIHHAFCFTCDVLLSFYLGITLCVNDSIMRMVKNFQIFKPDIILVVPMIAQGIYYKLLEAAKANENVPKPMLAASALGGKLKTIYCGGAYLNPALIKGFEEFGVTLVQGYGMTECSPRISNNFEWECKIQSVGKLVDGCEAKIVDDEIWVKSPSVMMGYYKDEENTKNTLADGWLKTGDLGYIDEDNFVFLTGRKKNLIILSNGENISAEELENKLSNNPIIGEVLVYGEENLILAEIFPNHEIAKAMGVTNVNENIQQFVDIINEKQAISRRIHSVKIRDVEFEKTTSKKIKRKNLMK